MFTQGSLYVQEWKNGVAEYVEFSDIHITCKYGWKNRDNYTTTQVGTLTDVSLAEWSSHDFITIPGDSHTVEASWDDEQHMMESPVLYDIVFTVDNMKINKMSWNPTNNGWTTIMDCETVDTGINNGYDVEFLNSQKDINVETQTDTKAWSTTEPYFGTGVIADGAYYNGNIYLITDSTNHPGELSINEIPTWNSSDILKYSKQTSGLMFYLWNIANITQCTRLNHYTWDVSEVFLGYDYTNKLIINGVTYTKQNPSPSYYEIKCQFNYGGSVRPAKTFIRWGTNEPYSEVIYGGVNPEAFSWQESSVPSGEIGTLVVEFVDSNNNGLTVDSYSSQDYYFDTDNAGSYGGTRLLIKSLDDSNIYDYAAGNFIECNITLANAQPVVYENTVVFAGATVSQVDINADNGEGYVTFNVVNNTIQFNDGDYWWMKKLKTTSGIVSAVTITDPNGDTLSNSITNSNATLASLNENPGTWTVDIDAEFSFPDLIGRYYFNSQSNEVIYFSTSNTLEYGSCGGTYTYSYEWEYNGERWVAKADRGNGSYYNFNYYEGYDMVECRGVEYDYSSTDPCGGPTPYSVTIVTEGQGTVDGIHSGDQTGQYYLTAIPDQGWVFDHWYIAGLYLPDNPLDTSFPNAHQTVYVYFVQEGPGPQPTEKHIYLCDNSGAHLAEMTKTGSTWNVTGSFTSGMYSVRATVEGEYNDAWFKFYQAQGDNRIFVGAGDDPDFEEIGTYIVVDNILTSFSLTEDQETGYYVVSYENTGAMTTSMVDTIVNSYIGDFVTGSDIAEMGYMTQTDISSMSYVDTTYLANQDYSTKSYMMSYVSDAISGIQPGGSSTKTVTMSCTGGTEYELDDAIFYIPNKISNVTFVQKWQRTNSTSGTWTIYNFNMGSTAEMRIGLPTDKYVSSLTLTCNGYSDTFNVTTVPTTSSYQDITIYYWGFQHVWQYLNDYDWTMTIVYSNKPQSIDIDWMINNSTLQSLASNKGLTSVEHGSQDISDFTSDVVLTDMKTLDNSGKTNVYLNGVSSSMEDMVHVGCLLFRTSNLNAANPTKSDIESIWETVRWNCIEEYGTPATIGDWEVVYYINGSDWCPADTDLMTISGDPTQLQNNFDVSNWTEQPSDQYKYFYYIKTIEIMSME